MRCKKCGQSLRSDMDVCPHCGLPLLVTDKAQMLKPLSWTALILRGFAIFLGFLVTLCLFTLIGVRLHYWYQDMKFNRDYVAHTVEKITTADGMDGHAISFFGDDGDTLYINELKESYLFVGGVARVEFADQIWFEDDPVNTDSARVTVSPVLTRASGMKIKLPSFSLDIDVPEAPINIIAPKTNYLSVITSITPLQLNVIYGSQVIINGEDVTERVDRSGDLALNLNVEPIGDNIISIIVRTPHHLEARRDLVFYRDKMEINLEIATSVAFTSTLNYMTVSGTTEPGAWIEVETEYNKDSLIIDQETGAFSFQARFSDYGNNLVHFRATKPGFKDSQISFYVKYLPAMAEYQRIAWAMDYRQLRTLYEQWHGRAFLCKGLIVDTYMENNTQFAVMDVGKDGEVQWLVLENQSDVGSFKVGSRYGVYADVAGRLFYTDAYYPYLIGRYGSILLDE